MILPSLSRAQRPKAAPIACNSPATSLNQYRSSCRWCPLTQINAHTRTKTHRTPVGKMLQKNSPDAMQLKIGRSRHLFGRCSLSLSLSPASSSRSRSSQVRDAKTSHWHKRLIQCHLVFLSHSGRLGQRAWKAGLCATRQEEAKNSPPASGVSKQSSPMSRETSDYSSCVSTRVGPTLRAFLCANKVMLKPKKKELCNDPSGQENSH